MLPRLPVGRGEVSALVVGVALLVAGLVWVFGPWALVVSGGLMVAAAVDWGTHG